jgi:hypothetical protein
MLDPGIVPRSTPYRELKRRSVVVTDETKDIEVHTAAAIVVTLTFPVDVRQALLADPDGRFDEPQRRGRVLVLLPKRNIPRGHAVIMTVTLEDGTLLPNFVLSTLKAEADLTLDVDVQMRRKAGGDSASALKMQVTELQSRLDECQQAASNAGTKKVAELVLRQDFSKPAAFVAERHGIRVLDKQSRILVQLRTAYRLFDSTYLVLTAENRDPDKAWVMERAEISIAGGSSAVETRVLHVTKEMDVVPPGVESRMAITFQTPTHDTAQRFVVRLFEKNGNRHVELTDVKL